MSTLVKMNVGKRTILVEAANDNLRLLDTGEDVTGAVDKAYEELVQNEIVENCRVLVGAFEKLAELPLAPNKGTAEFGLQFTAGGDIYLVKASAQASITITLEWTLFPVPEAPR